MGPILEGGIPLPPKELRWAVCIASDWPNLQMVIVLSFISLRVDDGRCFPCTENSHSAAGSNWIGNCSCIAGFTQAENSSLQSGLLSCEACAPGKYKSESGHVACSSCPVGKVSQAIAATSPDMCRFVNKTTSARGQSDLQFVCDFTV